MVRYPHSPIVADDEVLTRRQRDLRHVPWAAISYVGFDEGSAVHVDLPLRQGDSFPGKRDDAFHVEHVRTRKLDCDNIASRRLLVQVRETIHEIQRT